MNRILVIPDLHAPYNLRQAVDDTRCLINEIKPNTIVVIGDVIDSHTISRHTKEPEAKDVLAEFKEARDTIQHLNSMFGSRPVHMCSGNHEDRLCKMGKVVGIPSLYFKTFNELFDVNWYVKDEHIINDIYFTHGKTSTIGKLALSCGISAVQGHYHSMLSINYFKTVTRTFFDAFTGSFADDSSLAMKYSANSIKKSIYGTLSVIEGRPRIHSLS